MNRLKDVDQVIYDANIIIYYSFPEGKYRLIGLTKPAEKLTNFLFNQDSKIVVPSFIISEIEHNGYFDIIEDYFLDMEIDSKYRLLRKVRKKFEKLLQHDNFLIENYEPPSKLLESINDAYVNFNNLDNIDAYFMEKHIDTLNPSIEDKMLILFSKEKKCPVVSNALDLTFFRKYLLKLNLVHEIIDFRTITSMNN